MKQIENIFSKKSDAVVPAPNKFPIIVDTREKQSLVYSYLVQKKANVRFEKLEIGDFLAEDVVVERKTFKNFQASIMDKRLVSQLAGFKKYSNCFLMLEGFLFDCSDLRVHENAIRGMILSSVLDFGILVVYTEGEEDSAKMLLVLTKRLEKDKRDFSLRYKKSEMGFDEQKQFILEGFPGVGSTTSKALIEKFGTLDKVFNSTEKTLKETSLFDEKKLDKFRDLLKK